MPDPELIFVLGDKLPLICDAVLAIYSASRKSKCQKRVKAMHAYAVALQKMWIKSFGKEHVQQLTPIKCTMNKYMDHFNTKVVIEASRKRYTQKDMQMMINKSFRHYIKEWRISEIPVRKYG